MSNVTIIYSKPLPRGDMGVAPEAHEAVAQVKCYVPMAPLMLRARRVRVGSPDSRDVPW